MPDAARAFVLAVRLGLELALLAALGYAAFRIDAPLVVRALAAAVLVGAAATLWGVYVSPKARVRLAPGARLGVELALFALAAAALALVGELTLALALFALAAVWSGLARI